MIARRPMLAAIALGPAVLSLAGCATTSPIAEAEWVEIDPTPRDHAGSQNFVVLAAGDGAGYAVYEQYLALRVRDRLEALAEAHVDHPAP